MINALEPDLFTRISGNLHGVDGIVLARIPGDIPPGERDASATFEQGVIDGVAGSGADSAGVELVATDPSTLGPFIDAGMTTIDHLDLPAGQVGLVYALDGYAGNYGIKEEARSYMPDFGHGPTAP